MPCQRKGAGASATAPRPNAGSAAPAARIEMTRRRLRSARMVVSMVVPVVVAVVILMRMIDGQRLRGGIEIDHGAAVLLRIGFGRFRVGERHRARAIFFH